MQGQRIPEGQVLTRVAQRRRAVRREPRRVRPQDVVACDPRVARSGNAERSPPLKVAPGDLASKGCQVPLKVAPEGRQVPLKVAVRG